MTYTYAILDVSPECYEEIAEKLKAVSYGHTINMHDDLGHLKEVIDMQGIGLRAKGKHKTLTSRVSEFVRRHPGRTAWGVAKELGASSATVSSILRRLAAKGGKLRRAKGARGSWVYYDRRFGHDC